MDVVLDTCIALSSDTRQRHVRIAGMRLIRRHLSVARGRPGTSSATVGSALAGVALVLMGAVAAQAQPAELQGVFEIDASASDNIEAAITRGTAQMNFAIRPLARRLIAKANPPYQRIGISRTGNTASLQLDARPSIQTPLDGSWVRWVREDGGIDSITGQWSYAAFVVYFKGEDGSRIHKYLLDSDGQTLRLYVELTSPRLPGPIDYTLVYRRH
jgi:hypothetical protein